VLDSIDVSLDPFALPGGSRNDDPMPDEPVRLRPIEEADLDTLRRFDIDPSSRGPYLSSDFRSPQIRRRRWEEDGWLGGDSGQLAVARPDGTLAGIVAWHSIQTGGRRSAA
jgi:[ribosomal protein S5]-alanine N-acetyltransferase